MTSRRVVELAVLRAKRRKALPDSSFAIPGSRKYPIHDLAHARNALSRVAQHGTPEEQKQVRAAVARRYGKRIAAFRKKHHNTSVEDQKDIQLSAGYADHKPPYDFKHGWVPITGKAATAVAKKERQLPPNLRTKPAWKSDEEHNAAVERYFKSFPEGWKDPSAAPDGPLADTTPPAVAQPAKKAARPSRGKSGGKTGSPDTATEAQRAAAADPDYDSDGLTGEWEKTFKQGKLSDDESEAVHQWQNGFTEVQMGDDENEAAETGLYLVLNDMLREGGQYDLGALDEDDLQNLDLMNDQLRSALDKSEVTRDTTVYRGVSQFGDVEVGDVVTDRGWQATSYNPQIAEAFLGGGSLGAEATKDSRTLVIRMPKGSKALRVRERAEHERVFGIKHEVVIGPDTPMRVTGKTDTHVYMEVQPMSRDLAHDHSSSTHPDLPNKPGKTNWVEQQGGLPSFIKRVAKHIMADGHLTESHAIAAAVKQCRDGRFGAKGLAAYAEFRAKAAAARAS